MTNAEVEKVVAQAAARGIRISTFEATTFLGASALLEREPDNLNARQVVENFTRYLSTGTKPWSFAEFLLPEFCTDATPS